MIDGPIDFGDERKADAEAWKQGLKRLGGFLSEEEQQKIVLVQLYTAGKIDGRADGVPEAEINALLEWADRARINDGLLQNLLAGGLYVRMKGSEPEFSLSPKGMAEGKALGEKLGLPPLDNGEEPKRD